MRALTAFPILILVAACQTAPPALTEADRAAIEAELAQEFDAYADVVRGLDHDALMSFSQQKEDCVWAHNGVLTTSWEDLSEVSGQNWAAWASVESFAWGDLHIQVLAPNIAVVATTFDFAATDTTGAPVVAKGTFSTVWLHADGEWKIVNSAETYPPMEAAPEG